MIGDTIKETSCNYIKKIQGDARVKVNIFGGDSTVIFGKKVFMNTCLNSERLPRFLWDKADVIGDTIKETSCSYIKKIQGDSREKINIFGGDSRLFF